MIPMIPNGLSGARDGSSILGSGRSPGVGTGNPLQYSCLENSIDREVWWGTAHGVAKSQTQLSNWTTMIKKASWSYFESTSSYDLNVVVLIFVQLV